VLRETIERKLERIYSTHVPNHPVTLTIPSETVEKDDFGSPILLCDPNFLVCHIW
jgi:hypothetical protein